MKRFIIAVMFATLAVFATDARADNISFSTSQPSGTINFLPVHFQSIPFTDVFDFNGVTGLNSVEVIFDYGFDIANFSSAKLFSGPGLVTLTLLSGIPGTSFTLSPIILTGPLHLVVQGTTGSQNHHEYQAHLNVTSVPEPASLILLGAGLAGLGIWRRKVAKV